MYLPQRRALPLRMNSIDPSPRLNICRISRNASSRDRISATPSLRPPRESLATSGSGSSGSAARASASRQ